MKEPECNWQMERRLPPKRVPLFTALLIMWSTFWFGFVLAVGASYMLP